MRIIYTLLLLLITCYGAAAQGNNQTEPKTKEVTETLKHYNQRYHVLQDNPKLKHGPFTMGAAGWRSEGQYEMGKRSGLWSFYGWRDKLEYKFDFTTNQEVFADRKSDTIRNEVKVYQHGELVKTKVGNRPFYFGGDSRMFFFLGKNIRYPIAAQRARVEGVAVISLDIDEDGKASNHEVVKKVGYGIDEEALRAISLLPNEWVPAMIDGKPVKSRHYVPIKFTIH
ncbi:energy transducer TonB [Pontibacter ruber]|uniref:Energy transducer TonB n=1 Tax=Pontibacter ruber TaxID=1343895 RepID=A0ABW5CW82_9BACT|nr:energy transducer TonB [Pontibacter ruber]